MKHGMYTLCVHGTVAKAHQIILLNITYSLWDAKHEKCADKFLLYAQFLPLYPVEDISGKLTTLHCIFGSVFRE